MKLSVAWKWFDLWVGAYWDAGHRTLYVCPLPTVVFRLEFRGPKDESKHRADRSRPVIPTTGILDHTPELDKAEYEALIRECDRLMGEGTKAALERNEAQAENEEARLEILSAKAAFNRIESKLDRRKDEAGFPVEVIIGRVMQERDGLKAENARLAAANHELFDELRRHVEACDCKLTPRFSSTAANALRDLLGPTVELLEEAEKYTFLMGATRFNKSIQAELARLRAAREGKP